LPIVIFSKVRLGVTPEINALATVMIVVVAVAVIGASWAIRRQLSGRDQNH
jgi:putrescine transport system permease protein